MIGRSLHIGLNGVDPAAYGWDGHLDGCENDALAFFEIMDRDPAVYSSTLLTSEATADAVLAAFGAAGQQLDAGDLFVVSYAGHGSYLEDLDDDEPDGCDETWVLYDRQLVDDEIRAACAGFRAGVRVLIISDSCHSGSVTRAAPGPMVRGMPSAVRTLDQSRRFTEYHDRRAAAVVASSDGVEAAVVLLAACQDDQEAQEHDGHGVFTNALLGTWNGGAFDGSVQQLFDAAAASVAGRGQDPNLDALGVGTDALLGSCPFRVM